MFFLGLQGSPRLKGNTRFLLSLFLAEAEKRGAQTHTVHIDKKNIQVVFVYRFQPPFGFVQLAYQRGTGEFGEKGTQGHTLFFKVTYVF